MTSRKTLSLMVMALLMVFTSFAWAHFHTPLPTGDDSSFKRNEEVNFTYFWGHPYEHMIFNTPVPDDIFILEPDGGKKDLSKAVKEKEMKGPEGKVTGRVFSFTPEKRGDHILCVNAPAIFIEEEELFWQDYVKLNIHVQQQHGWDAKTNQKVELVPLTRPYGLEAGFIFRAQAFFEGKPLPNAEVEIEKYNPKAPKEEDLPEDAMITRVAKTDPSGVVAYTLDEPGWWVITVAIEKGTKKHGEKEYPLVLRGSYWVYVGEKFTQPLE